MNKINKINKKDYINILNFYNINIPKSNKSLKNKANKILSTKLCRCIKKVGKKDNNEKRAIGICTKTIFNLKGFTRGKFNCKKKANVTFRKSNKNKTSKNYKL